MRCEDVVVELDAYSTGELDAGACAEIEQHIRQCISCRNELSTLCEENAFYRNYASIIIGSDPGKEKVHFTETTHLHTAPSECRRRLFSISGWRLATAAMIIMAISLFWYLKVDRSASEFQKSIIAEDLTAVPMDQALKDLERAIVLLQASYLEKKAELDPDLVAELDRNLEITRTAISECKAALEKDSGNRLAMEFFVFDYQKQLDILKYSLEGSW